MALKDRRINLRILICINLLAIVFFDSYPVYSSILPVKVFIYALKFLNLFSILYLLRNNYKQKIVFVILILPFFWAYLNERSIIISIQLLYSAILPLVTFILLKQEEQYLIVQWYIKLFYYLCLVGIPIYISINLLHIPPLFSFQRGEADGARIYDNYFFLYWTMAGLEHRFSSVFDEPGVIGTLIPIFIFYYREQLTKSQLFVFTIAGLLSFSLFFLLTIIPSFYFSKFRTITTKRKIFKTTAFILVILLGYFGMVKLALLTKSDPQLSLAIYNRFEWSGDWIVGIVNNRDTAIEGFNELYYKWLNPQNISFYIGMGKDYILDLYGGSTLSYRVFAIERGVLIIIYLFSIFIGFHPWKSDKIFSIISLLLLIAIFFQRPVLYSVNYFILIYTALQLFRYQFEKKPTEIVKH